MTAGQRSSSIGGSSSFLSEADTENDNNVEAGTFSTGSAGPIGAGASTYGATTTANYTEFASATSPAAGATIIANTGNTGRMTMQKA